MEAEQSMYEGALSGEVALWQPIGQAVERDSQVRLHHCKLQRLVTSSASEPNGALCPTATRKNFVHTDLCRNPDNHRLSDSFQKQGKHSLLTSAENLELCPNSNLYFLFFVW